MSVLLSAFEIGSPRAIPKLVAGLEAHGYERFWTTEHHSSKQSSSPAVIMATAAANTRFIKIGTIGLKLRYHNPLRTAKDFHLLEALFPGRIDLGMVDGRYDDESLHTLLLNGKPDDDYNEALKEVVSFVRNTESSAGETIFRGNACPRIWSGSMKVEGAEYAGLLGIGFVFHLTRAHEEWKARGREASQWYRDNFVSNSWMPKPHLTVVCSGSFARSSESPMEAWRRLYPTTDPSWTVSTCLERGAFCGSPADAYEQIMQMADAVTADEIAVQYVCESVTEQLEAYAAIADLHRRA